MENILTIHTDGGARGNPGPAAIGVVIEQHGKIIHEFGKTIGETTNNVAEYAAVIEALEYVKKLRITNEELRIMFFLDSKLVVEQLSGRFKIKNANLRELFLKTKILEQDLSADRQGLGSVVTYQYIPREKNKHADSLVNQALDHF